VASCPSGSIYKREEDGIVLVDQDKCRGWRMCISAALQEDLLQLEVRQGGEVHLLLPAHRGGQPTVCSESCVGRIRYLGVILYDADRIEEAPACPTRRNSTRHS